VSSFLRDAVLLPSAEPERCVILSLEFSRASADIDRTPNVRFGQPAGGLSMIERYSDHAANERTFLAWVRTGIATIAFGFVVEKFNLFVRTIAEANASDTAARVRLDRFSGAFSHYDGLVLILVGMAIIVLSLWRFVRTSRMIDDQQSHQAGGIKVELILAVVLGLMVMSITVYFAL
jgi:putative membrane protein